MIFIVSGVCSGMKGTCVSVFLGCCVCGIYYVRFQFDQLFCRCIKADINKRFF